VTATVRIAFFFYFGPQFLELVLLVGCGRGGALTGVGRRTTEWGGQYRDSLAFWDEPRIRFKYDVIYNSRDCREGEGNEGIERKE
jgi:hypothetical protein